MSLLLDALKRAEQEKLSRQGERPTETGRKERVAPASPPGAAAAPALELAPVANAAAAARASAAARTESEAANTAFHAKGAPAAPPPRKTGVLWAAGGAIVVVIAAIGAYVWYSMESLKPRAAPVATRMRPPTSPAPFTPSAPLPPRIEPAAAPPAAVVTAAPPARSSTGATDELMTNLLRDARAPHAGAAPLKLARTPEAARVPAEVSAGYDQLRDGDLAAARRSYSSAVAADGANLDAQLGLATVEARMGNNNAAAAHYRRALELDPRNGTALAGLAALADFSRPQELETQLRSDLARYPRNAALHFTLGNLYASQSRWGEAQAQYFEAHRLEPENADLLFNLAVSLDHLGQARVAADFYRRAVEAARGQAPQFDPAGAARRLGELR